MGSTFFSLHYHLVFSTKERRPFIKPEWQPRLHAYLGGIIKGMNGVAEIVGGVEDHVHILVQLQPVQNLAQVDLRSEFSLAHVDDSFFKSRSTSAMQGTGLRLARIWT